MRLGFKPINKKKRAQEYKCRVQGKGWVLGIF